MELWSNDGGKGWQAPYPLTAAYPSANSTIQDYSTPLSIALSITLEAHYVVGLASTLTKDVLALVDDITDLCCFNLA